MSNLPNFEDDVLEIDEPVVFNIIDSPIRESRCNPPVSATSNISQSPFQSTVPRLTSHVDPTLTQPAQINGRLVDILQVLKPTRNLWELRMRSNNSHQRFLTKDGDDIYLTRDIIQRINFEEVQTRKRKEKTINLPQRHQARLNVNANGEIKFSHYHQRRREKRKKVNNFERNRSTGAECSTTTSK